MKSIHHHALNLGLAGLLGAFSVAPAMAGEAAPSFKAYDSNGDGMVSLEEFVAQGGHEDAFRALDLNGNSSLSSDEFGKTGAPKEPKAKR